MKAVAYLRTSSKSNIEDSDSRERQERAILSYADRNGVEVIESYYDAGISGTVAVDERPEFCRLRKERLADMVLVETASRFARDLIVQEVGHEMLKRDGIELVACDDPDSFTEDTPTGVLIRQILGAVSQFERATITKRMRSGLDRVAKENGRRMEGNHGFRVKHPSLPGRAKELKSAQPDFSLRDIAINLALEGFTRPDGSPFLPGTVQRWVS